MVEIGSNAMRDVDDAGFGRIRSKGDQALFGGRTSTIRRYKEVGAKSKITGKKIAQESGVLPKKSGE